MTLTVLIAAPISNRASWVSGRAGRELKKIVEAKYPHVRTVFIPDNQCLHDHAGVIQKYKDAGPVFFNYFGHGVKKKLCGMIPPHCRNTPHGMFDPTNVGLLGGVITYANSCWTSAGLGQMVENVGGKAFVGYRKPLYVGFDQEERPYARDVIDVWHTFPLEMLKGNNVAGAIDKLEAKSKEYEDLYKENQDDLLYGDYYFKRFKSNRQAIVPFGDLKSMLEL